MALQPGKGKIEGKHYLPSTPETVRWGELPTSRTRPVLTVDSGATVTIDTVSQEGILEDQGRDPDTFFGRYGVPATEVLEDARAIAASGIPHRFGVDGPHVVTGPVFVRGAEPGDVLRVEIVSLLPRARYGLISNRHGQGLLAGEFPQGPAPDEDADARHWEGFRTVGNYCAVERRRGKLFGALDGAPGGARVRFPLAPFLGIMAVGVDVGVEPGDDDGTSPDAAAVTVPSTSVGLHGGALDCRELGVGARLYLPVQVPGALFAVGDPHYAAGDGKIGLTALEGPLRSTLRLSTLREPAARAALGALREPFVETEACWLTLGLDVDVTEAVRRAARSAVLFLSSRLGLEPAAALAYLSAAADFGISQLVNGVQTAYCRIRRSDFTEPPPARPRLPRAAIGRRPAGAEDGEDGVEDDSAVESRESDAELAMDRTVPLARPRLPRAAIGRRPAGAEDSEDGVEDDSAVESRESDAELAMDRTVPLARPRLPRAAIGRRPAGADNGDVEDSAVESRESDAELATDRRAAADDAPAGGPDCEPAASGPRASDGDLGLLPRQMASGATRRGETRTPPTT